jgi:hypothetical protein
LQAEQMTPSGTTSSSGFMTSLKNNSTLTTPYLWTFDPGVSTTAGYFYANGKLLQKITGPGPYVLRLNAGMLGRGNNKLGHAWDTSSGVHQSPASSYSEKINNVSGSGFLTNVTSGTAINAPYIWAFDPGTATSAGYFFADGNQLQKITGAGPYALMMNSTTLTSGSHNLGHAWDTTAGVHQTPASAYAVTYSPGTSTTSNYSVINDPAASGGQATKFGAGVTLTGSVNLTSSVTSLTVMTHGEQCSGSWPQMKVAVDGQGLVSATVSAASWTAYTANVTLNSGIHSVTITNTSSGSCLPNLYADVTNFYGPTTPPPPAPTVALSASPTSLTAGQSSTLTWSSTNATSCTASGAWSGSEPTSGSVSTGALNQNSTYSLSCTGAGGTATASTTVTVSVAVSSYDSAISYTKSRPAFTAIRTINVSSASALLSAISNLQAGDLVKATAPFTVTVPNSNTSGGVLNIFNRLSSYAEIDLTGVSIVYSGTNKVPGVYIRNASHLYIFGGDITTGQGGSCVLWFSSQYVTYWGFNAHNCGTDGLSMFTGKSGYSYTGPVQHNDIEGEVSHTGQNATAWDPHQEKCTGVHGANLADGNFFDFSYNRVALNVHDEPCAGGGIEFGSSQSTNLPHDNTIILQCTNMTYLASIQTGGNCYQTWGYGNTHTDIKFINATNLEGHPYAAAGLYSKPNTYLTTDTLEYGRASKVNLNPFEYSKDKVTWSRIGGTAFKDVLPLP